MQSQETTAERQLRWGIIGTGAIARTFARALGESSSGRLEAVGSRSIGSAEAFVKAAGSGRAHGSYEDLLNDPAVDAVYISTPHPLHAQWTIRALEAGKHVLCEKPLALNQWQAQLMIETARRQRRFLGEAFMYRFHPQIGRTLELIAEGAIGEVRMIEASFGFNVGKRIDEESRIFNNELGGGGILDVGCYAVSIARLIAGAAIGQPFADPVKVSGSGHIGHTNVDEWAAAVLQFESGITAQVSTAVRAEPKNTLEVIGSTGKLVLPDPWAADRGNAVATTIQLVRGGVASEEKCTASTTCFTMEADAVARAIFAGKLELDAPGMTWQDSLGNLKALDAWREELNLVYKDETPRPQTHDVAGRPLQVAKRSAGSLYPKMRYTRLAGLDKPVSKLVLGSMILRRSYTKTQVMFDHWLEVGGNAIDTAFVYGICDKLLGDWMTSRGVREELVVIAKGGHTPYCTPEGLSHHLIKSLEALQTDYCDIFVMHRDNPDVPVGEFIDVLNEHVRAGRMRLFGGSNWTRERFEAANAYAAHTDQQGMSALSNNLSLARMVDPVWPGCLHMSDVESRRWLKENAVINFAWSSQARGFFTPRLEKELAKPGFDAELRRCWLSDDNLRRRERCIELAAELGVDPINVAAAYVLCQPFESFALIGPDTVGELDSSLRALDVELSAEQIEWLYGADVD